MSLLVSFSHAVVNVLQAWWSLLWNYDLLTVWEEYDFFPHFVHVAVSQFNVETTTDSAMSQNMWHKSTPATENNESDTDAY